jgi:hypothetical protein
MKAGRPGRHHNADDRRAPNRPLHRALAVERPTNPGLNDSPAAGLGELRDPVLAGPAM